MNLIPTALYRLMQRQFGASQQFGNGFATPVFSYPRGNGQTVRVFKDIVADRFPYTLGALFGSR